mgnify:CR=1 FL=1
MQDFHLNCMHRQQLDDGSLQTCPGSQALVTNLCILLTVEKVNDSLRFYPLTKIVAAFLSISDQITRLELIQRPAIVKFVCVEWINRLV